jgi:Phosphotransferase enzyme family
MTAVTQHTPETARVVTPVPLDTVPEVLRALAELALDPSPDTDVVGYLGRNDIWELTAAGGRRVLVKRLTGPRSDTKARFERSVRFDRIVREAAPSDWRGAELLGAHEPERVLVFALVPDAVSVSALVDEPDAELAGRIGRAVGELHSLDLPASPDVPEAPAPERGPAGQLDALTPEAFAGATGAELGAWALLQHDKQVKRALARLREQSLTAPQGAAHCDLRLDQLLVAGGELYLLDGEEFRRADPAVDLGSLIGEWLHHAAIRMFSGLDDELGESGAMHDSLVRRGAESLAEFRPLIEAFWAGYRAERAPDPGLAERATAYAGWHLFDRMLSGSKLSAVLGAVERGVAGIGRSALANPREFVSSLGLEEA